MNEAQALRADSRIAASSVREYLATQQGWTTSGIITSVTGFNGVAIRLACQAYPRTFVSSTEGYKLAAYATRAEIQHNVASLIQRSTKMLARASQLSSHLARRIV